MQKNLIVTGIGTDVGKTVVSAILADTLKADYWKPIQCGEEHHSDSTVMKTLIDPQKTCIHPSIYSLQAPLSPHHASRLENIYIDATKIIPPQTKNTLIIETVGGIYVPFTLNSLCIDIYKKWNCAWIVVSKHYLGSINHTLLTIAALKNHGIAILGIVFNGHPNTDSEAAILEISQIPFLGRVLPEEKINRNIIRSYSIQWQPRISQLLH